MILNTLLPNKINKDTSTTDVLWRRPQILLLLHFRMY